MRTLAIASLSFAAAIFCANFLLPQSVLLPLGVILAGVCPGVWWLGRRTDRRKQLMAFLCCAGLGAGFLWMSIYTAVFFRPAVEMDDRTVHFSATVMEWPQEEAYGWSVLVRAKTQSLVPVTAILYTDEQGAQLRPGDCIETVAHCSLADRTFSGEEITYYTAKGVFLRAEGYGELRIARPEHSSPLFWPALLARELKSSIDKAFPERVSPLVRALVTGNREHLTDEFTSSLQRTGLSHTVAVSGMHLAFLSSLLTLLLGHGRRSTAIITVIWVLLFCGVAGNTPSAIRAAIMILLLQIAPLLNRERDDPTALAFALLLLLIWNPYSAAHVGLQLSFASVAGILLVGGRMQDWLLERMELDHYIKHPVLRLLAWVPRFILSTLVATLGASIFTVPLVALYFQTFSLIAPLANLLTLWAVALLFVGGLLVGLLGIVFPTAAAAAAIPFTWGGDYLNWMVDRLGQIPMAALSLNSVYYQIWVVFFCILVGLTLLSREKKRWMLPFSAAVVTLCASILFTAWTFRSGELTVAVLDVGQGQSVLLGADDYLALVDCGGDSHDNPGDVAADYIHALGRTSLDLLVVSHYHEDHANGIPQLLKRVDVSAIALPDVEQSDPLRNEILALARERQTEIWMIREATHVYLGEEQEIWIYPPLDRVGDTNELGLTVLATSSGYDVLLTGDMSGEMEERLVEKLLLPDIELLVVGHHGSKYSTTQAFLSAVRPETAVISVGAGNRYGHPSQQTLERLDRHHIEVYRTDQQGTVVIRYQNGAG